jgi:predicted ATP-dependent protease
MLSLRPSDFAQEVREHENFWLKDDDGATRADKRAALQLAQSSIDKVKERMPDGIYKEVMDDLMNKWNDA